MIFQAQSSRVSWLSTASVNLGTAQPQLVLINIFNLNLFWQFCSTDYTVLCTVLSTEYSTVYSVLYSVLSTEYSTEYTVLCTVLSTAIRKVLMLCNLAKCRTDADWTFIEPQ